jgi:hypothetical protein
LLNILLLLCNPWRRADSSSLSRLHCRHRDVNNAASLAGRESRSIGPQCTLIVELMHRRGLLMEVSIRGWQRSKSWVGVVHGGSRKKQSCRAHCFGLNRAKLPRSGDGRNYFGANPLTKRFAIGTPPSSNGTPLSRLIREGARPTLLCTLLCNLG